MTTIKKLLLSFTLILSSTNIYALEFGVFGDFTVKESSAQNANSSFAVGPLDLYATEEISDSTRAFIELVFEDGKDGLVVDLERFWVSRRFSDALNFSAGRFHTPLGRWNRTYHHGALIQDTIARPFFLDFEDAATGILPVHIVGVMFTGEIYSPNDVLNYEFALGNGPSINTSNGGLTPVEPPELEINTNSDNNSNKSAILRVVYSHDDVPLKMGVFTMSNEVAESADAGGLTSQGSSLVSQFIYGTDLLYTKDSFELLAEYYQFSNTNRVGSSGTYDATAWYIQMGYRINDDYKIIARTESLRFDAVNDVYFSVLDTNEANHNVLTLRYDMDESNALKFEIDTEKIKTAEDITTFTIQWAFLIP